eukprot:scaffold77840_cov69-Phaeocystis_antarctica.AAC.8
MPAVSRSQPQRSFAGCHVLHNQPRVVCACCPLEVPPPQPRGAKFAECATTCRPQATARRHAAGGGLHDGGLRHRAGRRPGLQVRAATLRGAGAAVLLGVRGDGHRARERPHGRRAALRDEAGRWRRGGRLPSAAPSRAGHRGEAGRRAAASSAGRRQSTGRSRARHVPHDAERRVRPAGRRGQCRRAAALRVCRFPSVPPTRALLLRTAEQRLRIWRRVPPRAGNEAVVNPKPTDRRADACKWCREFE